MLINASCRHCSFPVYLIHLLSVLLRCNGLAGIQKTVVDQMGSRPPNSNLDHFFGAFFWNFFSGQPLR